jgi:hypothetical protein
VTYNSSGNTILIDMIAVDGPLDLNMILGNDFVYALNVVASMFYLVMHFSHN